MLSIQFERKRSTLKEKRHRIKKVGSHSREERSTFKEEPPTLEKEGPTKPEAFCRTVHFADPVTTIPPEELDLLLAEEICGAASQLKPLFFTHRRLNK